MNINLRPFPELITDRLILRKLSIQDSNELMHLRSNDLVNRYLDRSKAITILEAKAFVKKIQHILKAQQGVYWAIGLKTDKSLIGTICFWNFDLENNTAEIGYELSPEHQGQGIMQEAIAKVIDYCFNEMQVSIITAFPRNDNESSIKLLLRNGFQRDIAQLYGSVPENGNHLPYWLAK